MVEDHSNLDISQSLLTCEEKKAYLVTFSCGCIINTFSFVIRMTTHANCKTVEKLVPFTGKQWRTFYEVRAKNKLELVDASKS